MTALPASSAFTGAGVTEGQFKTAITDQRAYLNELFGSDGTAITALQTVGALGNGVSNKTAAYTVVASDRGRTINATSNTWTLSITAAATLGGGFSFMVINSGAGVITIDPNASETINGAATKTLNPGESCICVTNGVNWWTVSGGSADGQFKTVQVFTASGTWNKPTNLKRVKVTVVGGGGGGGSDYTTFRGGGGGSAGASIKVIEAGSLGSSETVTIGAGGTAGTAGNDGGTGGTSSFGAHCSATGGAGGQGYNQTGTGGGGGGNGSGGSLNLKGQAGTFSIDGAHSGVGGNSILGGGSGGSGAGYGGGGGANNAGGAGVIFVEEFY